jgi:RHS repeat-associated protein
MQETPLDLRDGLGRVRQLADASGAIVQSYTYAPFGELLAAQGTRSSALQYTGEQKDVDTGLVYLRARWYDSATGRFTSRDPFQGFVGLPQTQHPYVYALNNPVNHTDPSGEFVDTIWDIFMVGLDVFFLLSDGIYYLLNPCADPVERGRVLGGDLLALGVDALLMVVPFAPGGTGLANKGILILTRTGFQVAPLIRVGQATAKGVQVGTHLAQAGQGSSGGKSGVSGGSGSGKGSSSNLKTNITEKIRKQMAKRGWTEQSIKDTVDSPYTTCGAYDKATGHSATAYYNKDGSYVVRNDVTGDVVQISKRGDPNWTPDSSIVNPYKPTP